MAEAHGELVIDGLSELLKTLKHAPKDVRLGIRKELRLLGEPVRSTAERLATERIPRNTVAWSKMRTGVTQKGVYVAPRQRGVKTRGRDSFRRPTFGTLLARRATQPALRQNQWRIERDMERMLDRLVTKWNHEGRRAA